MLFKIFGDRFLISEPKEFYSYLFFLLALDDLLSFDIVLFVLLKD